MGEWSFWNVRQPVQRRSARFARRAHGRGPLLVALGDSHTDPRSTYTFPRQVWVRQVARAGYRTWNLGISGDTTAGMYRRIEQTLAHGPADAAVLFGGANDALQRIDPRETERNAGLILDWWRARGVSRIAVIGPELPDSAADPNGVAPAEAVRGVLRDLAARQQAVFVDLEGFFADRAQREESRRAWHVYAGDPHYNAHGQRLVAQAFLAATAAWREG